MSHTNRGGQHGKGVAFGRIRFSGIISHSGVSCVTHVDESRHIQMEGANAGRVLRSDAYAFLESKGWEVTKIMEILTELDLEDSGTVDQEELVLWHDATVAWCACARRWILRVLMCISVCVYVSVNIHARICMCVYANTRIIASSALPLCQSHVYVHTSINIYVYIQICIYICTYVNMCTCMYIRMCIRI